jgi:AAA+ ATPase superfamily predicted ATPase
MDTQITGRDNEQKRLQELYDSDNPEFIAIYGRRRVGKTYLIRRMFGDKFIFDLVGLANASAKEQCSGFISALEHFWTDGLRVPKS